MACGRWAPSWCTPATSWGTARPNAAGHAFADLWSVVLQLPAESYRWVQAAGHLHAALMDEVSTHQAVGMVAAGLGTDIPTAALRLAQHAERLEISRALIPPAR